MALPGPVTSARYLVTHILNSVRKKDRVTARVGDIWSEQWRQETEAGKKEPRSRPRVRASEIAIGRTTRRTAITTAASGEPASMPAKERADLSVLADVTAQAA
jgi:hypothetical protein